jgi:flagellar biosynthesis protein FliQ
MQLIELARQALVLGCILSAPVLVASLVASAVMGFITTSVRLQDPQIAHLPRQLAVAAVLLGTGTAGASLLVRFATELFRAIPRLVP